MKSILPIAASAVLAVLLLPPSDGYASSVPADSVHFCLPAESAQPNQRGDYEDPERDHPRPAGKWASDLNVGEPRNVRLFYFLPNDRSYRTEVVDSMKSGILDLQTFFGKQMEAQGHGNTTFRIETDDQGDPIVHRVDGDYADSHYSSRGYTEGEIKRAFDNSKNIMLIVMDVSARSAHGRGKGAKDSGWAMIYGEWNWFAAAHELGHAFGLHHDFRDNKYIQSYGRADRSSARLSACAAEFLSAHPYFNADVPLANESPPTVELVSSEYPFGSESTPVQLRVRDDDGLHQVILFVRPKNPFLGSTPEVKVCHGLSGETDTLVDFNFDGRLPSDNVGTVAEAHTTLSNTGRHPIYVVAVDTAGNRTSTASLTSFTLEAGNSPQHIATLDRPYYYDIGGLAISPGGAHLAIGTGGTVELLDAVQRERKTVFRHTGGNAYVNWSVAFSPDGTLLASGSANGTIKMWNVNTRKEVATLEGHTGRVLSLDFSPDGSMLASGSLDRTVRLWHVATGAHSATLEGHSDGILSVAFVPDGTLVSKSNGGGVKLWNVTTRSEISSFDTDAAGSVAVSPDGASLASRHPHGYGFKLWNIATGMETGTYQHMRDYPWATFAFSPDGAILAVADNGLIEIWNVSTKDYLATISAGPGSAGRLIFSPDGKQLIATANKAIKFWDVSEWTGPITPVCDRTPQVRDAIVAAVSGISNCRNVTESHLAAITILDLQRKGVTALKAGDFDGLDSVIRLWLRYNELAALPVGLFDGLTSLRTLYLNSNRLTSLPAGIFDGLTELRDLHLSDNALTSLPAGIFDGLTELRLIWLRGNALTSLPAGIFDGLTEPLIELVLSGNAVDPLPLFVSLEKVGTNQFKAVAPSGVPFDIVLPLTITNGSITGGTSTLTIPVGSVGSETLTVTRTPGTTFAVTVNIGDPLPVLPGRHQGYVLVRSANLPLAVTEGPVETEVWSGRITVGVSGDSRGYFGRNLRIASAPYGTISDADFVYRGSTYRIGWIMTWNGYEKGLSMGIVGSAAISGCDLRHWTLYVEGLVEGFVFSDAEYNDGWTLSSLSSYSFSPGPDRFPVWNANDQIDLRLTYTDLLAPDAPSVAAINEGNQVKLSWIMPCDGGSEIAGFEYRKRLKNGAFGPWTSIPGSAPNETNATGYTTGNLDNANEYLFEVRAVNELGAGKVSRETNVIAPPLPVCSRTPQVRDVIVSAAPESNCSDVTPAHLGEINALRLASSGITALKSGDFSGLTGLAALRLGANPGSPFSFEVSLEKVGVDQCRAIAPMGAPFELVLPLTVTNGSISGGATTITIARGSVESKPLTVTRTSGTTAAVTVNIGTLPGLPSNHFGYALVKSSDLPLEIISSGVTGGQAATDFNGDGRTDFVDFFLFADAYGGTDARFDLDGNGTVDFADFFKFVDAFGS